MTRTERAMFPRAIIKDRSESKSGLDKSLRKSGSGQHNWGSLRDELRNETAALDDEFTEEELLRAAEMEEEKNAEMFKKYGLDSYSVPGMYGTLKDIPEDVNAAIRPAVDGPPSPTTTISSLGSTTSNPTARVDEEIEEARKVRARGFRGNLDLSAIARSSAGAGRAASLSPK